MVQAHFGFLLPHPLEQPFQILVTAVDGKPLSFPAEVSGYTTVFHLGMIPLEQLFHILATAVDGKPLSFPA